MFIVHVFFYKYKKIAKLLCSCYMDVVLGESSLNNNLKFHYPIPFFSCMFPSPLQVLAFSILVMRTISKTGSKRLSRKFSLLPLVQQLCSFYKSKLINLSSLSLQLQQSSPSSPTCKILTKKIFELCMVFPLKNNCLKTPSGHWIL